ncbi:hypothetical protein J6590_023731 [Homalodisca vitripennis]|nr:hypothetical protein J6590_023731 [Homalodisca vitripennis]
MYKPDLSNKCLDDNSELPVSLRKPGGNVSTRRDACLQLERTRHLTSWSAAVDRTGSRTVHPPLAETDARESDRALKGRGGEGALLCDASYRSRPNAFEPISVGVSLHHPHLYSTLARRVGPGCTPASQLLAVRQLYILISRDFRPLTVTFRLLAYSSLGPLTVRVSRSQVPLGYPRALPNARPDKISVSVTFRMCSL